MSRGGRDGAWSASVQSYRARSTIVVGGLFNVAHCGIAKQVAVAKSFFRINETLDQAWFHIGRNLNSAARFFAGKRQCEEQFADDPAIIRRRFRDLTLEAAGHRQTMLIVQVINGIVVVLQDVVSLATGLIALLRSAPVTAPLPQDALPLGVARWRGPPALDSTPGSALLRRCATVPCTTMPCVFARVP